MESSGSDLQIKVENREANMNEVETFEALKQKLLETNSELGKQREINEEIQILHNNVVEHSTGIENELEEQNTLIKKYLNGMKKYLSPQLYQMITGMNTDVGLTYKRKKLTCFFSDIVNFSTITDSIEPEALSQCLNYYLDQMSRTAFKYNGTIDKFIGDAIMVFFGDPVFESDEKHAQNCVKMGVEMQQRMAQVNEYWRRAGIPSKLMIRMGINTGYMTVGNFGTEERMDYTVIGGQVNIASRLESVAKPGTVVISSATMELVKDIVHVQSLGEVKVKGIHMPILIYEVLGLKEKNESELLLLQENEEGFYMNPIYYNHHQTSHLERMQLIDSLKQACSLLENRQEALSSR